LNNRYKIVLAGLLIIFIGLSLPQRFSMPVEGATKSDYNKDTFWFYPWGNSVTHKGVDIFAREGTILKSSTYGLILFSGTIRVGGNVVLILGPKWRLHYYAHLGNLKASSFSWVSREEAIGIIGSTGNAKGKAPHLHYEIVTPIPHFWRIDSDKQGWMKMFYLNPLEYLNSELESDR